MEIRHNSIFNLREYDSKNKVLTHEKWKNTIFQEFQKDYKISNKYFKHEKRVSNSDAIDHQPVRSNKNINEISLNLTIHFSLSFCTIKNQIFKFIFGFNVKV